MSEAIVEALRGLPSWQHIDFVGCVWPDDVDLWAQVKKVVPGSFEWVAIDIEEDVFVQHLLQMWAD